MVKIFVPFHYKHFINLISGCHVLVTTPRSLIRLLDDSANLLVLDNCLHLVVEDADKTLSLFSNEIKEIVKSLWQHKTVMNKCQIIVSSNAWNEAIRQFVKAFMMPADNIGPYFVIGYPVEAIKYAKLPLTCVVRDDHEGKLEALLEVIGEQKVVVMCTDLDVVQEVAEAVILNDKEVEVVDERMDIVAANTIVNKWWNSDSVLIVSDKATLPPMGLTQDVTVIHFDYPKSRFRFSYRFAHVKNCFKSFYDECKNYDCKANVILLISTAQDSMIVKTLVDVLVKSGQSIAPELKALYKQRLMSDLEERRESGLCRRLKLFGFCEDKIKCKARHTLHDDDVKDDLQLGNVVEFEVKTVVGASQFLVKVSRIFQDKRGQVVLKNFLDKASLIKLVKLANVKHEDLDLILTDELVEGLRCVVKGSDGCLKRARIHKMTKEPKHCKVNK